MRTEDNTEIAHRFLEEGIGQGNLAIVDELLDHNYGDYGTGEKLERKDFIELISELCAAFPDRHMTIKTPISNGNWVKVHWTARVTHKGVFKDMLPTCEPITVTGSYMARIVNSKIVTGSIRWNILDVYTPNIYPVKCAEWDYIKKRRKAIDCKSNKNSTRPENLVGLALSGGGIRSATFNLGVLQALSKKGILPWIDYLSTVSGGGYIGSCLTTLLAEQPRENGESFKFSTCDKQFPFNPNLKVFITLEELLDELNENLKTLEGRSKKFVEGDAKIELDDQIKDHTKAIELTKKAITDDLAETKLCDKLQPLLKRISERKSKAASVTISIIKQDNSNGLCIKMSTEIGSNIQLRHLINKGYFLISRARVFHRDTMRAVGTILLGSVYMLAIFIALLVAVSAFHYGVADLLAPGLAGNDIEIELPSFLSTEDKASTADSDNDQPSVTCLDREPVPLLANLPGLLLQKCPAEKSEFEWPVKFYLLILAGGVLSLLVSLMSASLAERKWKWVSEKDRSEDDRREISFLRIGGWSTLLLLALVVVGGVIFWERSFHESTSQIHIYRLWSPLLFMIMIWFSAGLIHVGVQRFSRKGWTARFRSMVWSYQGLMAYGILFALIFTLLALPHYFSVKLPPGEAVLTSLAMALISGAWSLFLARDKEAPSRGLLAKLPSLPPGFRNGLLTFLVVLFILSLIFLLQTLIDPTFDRLFRDDFDRRSVFYGFDLTAWMVSFGITLIFLFLSGVLLFLVNLNRISPHYFYRDRLSEAFLKTEITTDNHEVETVRDDSEMALSCLNPDDCTAPYHLIVAAVNMAGSRNQAYRDRKSDHFIFSRYYCGSEATGYVKTEDYMDGEVQVAQAVAISAAAVGSSLGYRTSFAQAFITTILNLRLGYWMANPSSYKSDRGSANSSCFSRHVRKIWEWISRPFRQLWNELNAKTNVRSSLVNLSDGGHTGDNIGLYPLLQRRCKVIIASDAGEDPDYDFDDLEYVIRQATINDNITIDINLEALRPDPETGCSRSHYAIGKIKYPDKNEEGHLIYLKPTMTGHEDEEIPLKNCNSQEHFEQLGKRIK